MVKHSHSCVDSWCVAHAYQALDHCDIVISKGASAKSTTKKKKEKKKCPLRVADAGVVGVLYMWETKWTEACCCSVHQRYVSMSGLLFSYQTCSQRRTQDTQLMAAVFAVCLFFFFYICAAVMCMSLSQLPPYSWLASFDLTFDNRIVEKTTRYTALLIFCPSPIVSTVVSQLLEILTAYILSMSAVHCGNTKTHLKFGYSYHGVRLDRALW